VTAPCARWRDTLLTTSLRSGTDAALADHLAECEACRSVAERLRSSEAALASALDDERPQQSVEALVAVAAWAQRAGPRREWRHGIAAAAAATATVIVALLVFSGIIISIVRRFGG
jgi:anti-sigma factor RsiW